MMIFMAYMAMAIIFNLINWHLLQLSIPSTGASFNLHFPQLAFALGLNPPNIGTH